MLPEFDCDPFRMLVKLERITGLRVHFGRDAVTQDAANNYRFVSFDTQELQEFWREWGDVIGLSPSVKLAARDFLNKNLDRIRSLKMEEQGGRCKLCTSTGPLQLDHIKPRSKGRDDRPENLRLLCPVCHETKTGTLKWKGTI